MKKSAESFLPPSASHSKPNHVAARHIAVYTSIHFHCHCFESDNACMRSHFESKCSKLTCATAMITNVCEIIRIVLVHLFPFCHRFRCRFSRFVCCCLPRFRSVDYEPRENRGIAAETLNNSRMHEVTISPRFTARRLTRSGRTARTRLEDPMCDKWCEN